MNRSGNFEIDVRTSSLSSSIEHLIRMDGIDTLSVLMGERLVHSCSDSDNVAGSYSTCTTALPNLQFPGLRNCTFQYTLSTKVCKDHVLEGL